MDYARETTAKDRVHAFSARASRARGWARVVYALLVAAFLFGAWQDRALAPPVHDGMKVVVERTRYAVENSDEVRTWLKGLFSSTGGGISSAKPQYDPVTRFLLQWQN